MTTIVQLAYDARDHKQVVSSINVLSKKQSQMKDVIKAMVELAMGWLDEVKQRDGLEKWLELVETLRTVTEGKVRAFDFAIVIVTYTHRMIH